MFVKNFNVFLFRVLWFDLLYETSRTEVRVSCHDLPRFSLQSFLRNLLNLNHSVYCSLSDRACCGRGRSSVGVLVCPGGVAWSDREGGKVEAGVGDTTVKMSKIFKTTTAEKSRKFDTEQ